MSTFSRVKRRIHRKSLFLLRHPIQITGQNDQRGHEARYPLHWEHPIRTDQPMLTILSLADDALQGENRMNGDELAAVVGREAANSRIEESALATHKDVSENERFARLTT